MSRVLSALTPLRPFLIAMLLGAVVGCLIVGQPSCTSTVKSPVSGKEVTREQLAAEVQVAEATSRADALEKVAAEQLKKDEASREARLQLGKLERSTTSLLETANAAHAAQVREIRTTTDNAIAEITATVDSVHGRADAVIASTGRTLEAELSGLQSSFAAANSELDRKDARTAMLTGGLIDVGNQVVPIAAAAAGPAGGIVNSVWGILSGVLLGGGAAGAAGLAAKKKADAKAADEAAARKAAEDEAKRTKLLAERSIDAIEVAKDANPTFKSAFGAVADLIAEYAGHEATKFVHDLKSFDNRA